MEGQNFRLRYRHVIEEIHERYPGFWSELRDLVESRDRQRSTTRGAVVREFPRTRDQGPQASGGRTVGQRLFEVAAPACRHAGTQTEQTSTRSTGIQADDTSPTLAAAEQRPLGRGRGHLSLSLALRRPGQIAEINLPPGPLSPGPGNARLTVRESAGSRTVAPTRPPTKGSSVCWNCRATDHRYSTCPLPKDRQYCYGCGRENVTLRTCPRCRDEWKDLGPYHPDRGHLGK